MIIEIKSRFVCFFKKKKKKERKKEKKTWHTTPEPSRAKGRRKYYPGTWQPAAPTQRTVGTEVCRAPLQTMSHRNHSMSRRGVQGPLSHCCACSAPAPRTAPRFVRLTRDHSSAASNSPCVLLREGNTWWHPVNPTPVKSEPDDICSCVSHQPFPC